VPLRRRVKRMRKTAVVLFNLGGPDRPGAVQPFLFNLFNDPAIIGAPGPLRWLLAQWISRRRAPLARKIYEEIGGASPLLANTEAQAKALEAALNAGAGDDRVRVFITMRYWHPMSGEVARAVEAYGPDQVVLLPLYPQFSTTTTGSSFTDWARAAAAAGLGAPTRSLCCYPTQTGFVTEVAGLLRSAGAVERCQRYCKSESRRAARQAGACLRDLAWPAPGTSAGDRAHWLRRGALDRGQLHDRGPNQP